MGKVESVCVGSLGKGKGKGKKERKSRLVF